MGLYSQFYWVHLSLKLPGDQGKGCSLSQGGMSRAGASEKNVPSWYEGSWQGLGQRDKIPLLEQQEFRPRVPFQRMRWEQPAWKKKLLEKALRKVP